MTVKMPRMAERIKTVFRLLFICAPKQKAQPQKLLRSNFILDVCIDRHDLKFSITIYPRTSLGFPMDVALSVQGRF